MAGWLLLALVSACGDDSSSDQGETSDETDEATDVASDITDDEPTDEPTDETDVEETDSETDVPDETDVEETDSETDVPDETDAVTDDGEAESATLIDDPLGDFPERLSSTGIYPDPSDRSTIAVEALEYVPRFPLWSNGLDKQRGIVVPGGERVVLADGQFDFPPGTLIYKTFSGERGAIETRLLRRTEDDWDYAVYLWHDEGDDAVLLDGRMDVETRVLTEWGQVSHTVPGRLACRQCHESSASFVLGFQPEQLLDADGGFEQLTTLQDADVIDEVPEVNDPVEAYDGATREVLGYFIGNCTHCHNGLNGIASSYDLRPEAAFDNLVGVPTESSATAAGTRVVPGDPSQSIMFAAMSGETDDPEVKLMPPVGVQFIDPEGIELVRAWIEAL